MVREVGRGGTAAATLILLRRTGLFLWLSARVILGCAFILLGILGVILPILPGMPWLIIGTLLIGRRSRLLRHVSVWGKLTLRRWAVLDRPIAGALGRWALQTQRDTSRRLRRIAWWWAERQESWGRHLHGA